ncbi:MAG: hypothetical protein RIQ53_2351 [Pseudomonadota bacterium]|jgi:diguanylate cyclase (GGDEF)-like protein
MITPYAVDPDPEAARPKVLLVDDDDVTLILTGVALRERGFDIIEACSGEAALGKLAQLTPDIVVLDALMPGIDGFETCVALRRQPGFEYLPVLMLTGLDDEASINRAYNAGATDFYVKSTQWSLLAGRLRYLLRSARTRTELERSKAKLARAQDLARMGSFDWRREGVQPHAQLSISPEGLRVLALPPHQRVSLRRVLSYVLAPERRGFLRVLAEMDRQGSVLAMDVPFVLPDGRHRVLHVEAEPEYNEQGASIGYTGILQDVTERRVAEDRIRHLANYDSLTGLPNRRQLMWRAERALEHARRQGHQAAMLLIDLDRFKVINDSLGHAAGDELLVEVAMRLRFCVRHSDMIVDQSLDSMGPRLWRSLEAVGRLGGDEFIALLPEVGPGDVQRVAQRILEALRAPILIEGQECFVTCSVGAALFPADGHNVADLLRNADVAMYSVKNASKDDCALYSPMLAGRGREKLELEMALHKAIERDEIVLHYQPKIDVTQWRMVGTEALMRWQRGSTLVQPGDFIPLAEETGLIVPLSEWALNEAARQARVWQEAYGFEDSVAVNLPTRLFERRDLVEQVHRALTRHQLSNVAIKLEITETGLMKDVDATIPSLSQLSDIGVEISIDDFGTGYSSLARLTSLPISELKIDRSFVKDLGKAENRAVVKTIMALAKSLKLRVVAEGVENLHQVAVLHGLGCSVMQGYLFSRPVPADDLRDWLQGHVLPPEGLRELLQPASERVEPARSLAGAVPRRRRATAAVR